MLPRAAVDALFLQVFNAMLDRALSNLVYIKVPHPWQES